MFFVLSKILLFLISPSFWIIILMAWSFLSKIASRRRRLRITSIILFIVFTNPLLYSSLLLSWQPEPVSLPNNQKYSAAIHLGGITMTNRHKQVFFAEDADRFIQATKLFHTGAVDKIIVTGGSPVLIGKKRVPEANQLRVQLILQGIPDSCIIIENNSWNTFENAAYTKQILDSLKLPPPYILVTSAMHVPRATAVFQKAGLDVIAYPAAFKEVEQKFSVFDFIPSIDVLTAWNPFLKEVIGMAVYRISGKA